MVSSGLRSLCCCFWALEEPLSFLWGGVLLRSGVLGPSALAGLRTVGGSKPSGDESRLELGFPGISGEVHIRTPRFLVRIADCDYKGRLL